MGDRIPTETVKMRGCDIASRSDFNDKDKTTGYLALHDTSFTCIGPDRPPVKLECIDQYLEVVDMIPNYMKARYRTQF